MDEEEQHEEQPNMREQLNEMLQNLPREIRVFERGIDHEQMQAFQELSTRLGEEAKTKNDEMPQPEDILEGLRNPNPDWSEDEQKRRLVLASILGTVDIFRALQQLEPNTTGDVQQWVQIALMQCQMKLENELMDEPIGFIATGLGGKGDKIRYYFAVSSSEPLDKGKVRFIEQEYHSIAQELNVDMEDIESTENYLVFKVLVPIRVPIVELIVRGLEQFEFLDEEFWVTNVHHPSPEELQEWIEKKQTGEE